MMGHIKSFEKFNEEISLSGIAKGAILGTALLLSSCDENPPKLKNKSGKVEVANNFIGDVKVTKIRLTGGKSQFFVVYGTDKSGNIIRFSVDEFNFSPGDTIHLDIKNKVIYPIKDSSNIVHPEVWNRDSKDWEETKPIKSHKMI